MIDPIHMTQYGKTETQLEETLLFACCVAGKNAISTAKALDRFLLAGHKVVYDGWTARRKYRPFDRRAVAASLYGEATMDAGRTERSGVSQAFIVLGVEVRPPT